MRFLCTIRNQLNMCTHTCRDIDRRSFRVGRYHTNRVIREPSMIYVINNDDCYSRSGRSDKKHDSDLEDISKTYAMRFHLYLLVQLMLPVEILQIVSKDNIKLYSNISKYSVEILLIVWEDIIKFCSIISWNLAYGKILSSCVLRFSFREKENGFRSAHAYILLAIFGFVDARWPAEWKIHIKMEKNRRGRMYFNVTGKNGSHPRNARWFIRSLHLLPLHEPTDAFLAFSRFSFSFIYTHT